ncbi:cupin domain-containing protein [Robiginitalea sp. SC105]|uniref:cupin domain-containing protein n=1 Tax=Robiginitalea sp. SC105 TaxID=2762332 RepID=UPI00163ABAEE|nr:cupin domain-containing protein [Robiginitalea sp. SC105]MBC2839814.1 cupin domain-containing protein [Robiginitalea sp. SC105]
MKTLCIALKRHSFMAAITMILGLPLSGQETSLAFAHDDPALTWSPAPDFFPGCSFTILHGDMEHPNMDFLFKVEPNTDVVNHIHKSPERMILVSGEMEVTYEGEPTRTLKAGSYAFGPALKPHTARCLDNGPCVLFVAMVDPFDAVPVTGKE